jgi:hypothetical protein
MYRNAKNREHAELDPEAEHRVPGVAGLQGSEAAAFLQEVIRCGEEMLDDKDWALIGAAASRDEKDPPVAGKIRTKLHRARKKLAELTGWQKSEV